MSELKYELKTLCQYGPWGFNLERKVRLCIYCAMTMLNNDSSPGNLQKLPSEVKRGERIS